MARQMRVSVPVAFDVVFDDFPDPSDEAETADAECAADQVVFESLALVDFAKRYEQTARVHVDGVGYATVRIAPDDAQRWATGPNP